MEDTLPGNSRGAERSADRWHTRAFGKKENTSDTLFEGGLQSHGRRTLASNL